MLEIPKPVDVFSPQSSGSPKKVPLGGLCRKSTETIGTPSIGDSHDGAMRGSLKHSMNIFTRQGTLCSPRRFNDHSRSLLCSGGPEKKGGQDEAALGRSRGGSTSKLHLSLSEDWTPLRWVLTSGQPQ